ncbi:MAG: uracil-DNA glycosylase [Desulfomonile tiedjei]|nr:uracil-DNA glycosylase [Desulfomonile tiedjei]
MPMNEESANWLQKAKSYLQFQVNLGFREILVPRGENLSLEAVRTDLGDCVRCPLHKGRRNIVFGEGNPRARLMFIGEGPGADEDRQGRPFVGRAGQLLTRMIAAMGLERSQVYIANVVKCRPPDNRDPAGIEIRTCFPFLEAQIAAISPDVIVTLGRIAACTLLETNESISGLRGRFFDRKGIPLMPTYHPSFLLRQEPDRRCKGEAWADLQKVMELLCLRVSENGAKP